MDKSTLHKLLAIPEIEEDIPEGKWKRAAVLALFLPGQKGVEMLFTRRTDHVMDHKGQVSFPGGAVEPYDENLEMAALREAHEEIGIHPQDVEILGFSRDMFTVSGWWITPVVGWCAARRDFIANPAEVSRIFTLPITWLIDPTNWEKRSFIKDGITRLNVIYYRQYQDELLWGITAQLVHDLFRKLKMME